MTSIGHPPLDETGDGKADNADKLDGKHDGEVDADTVDGKHANEIVSSGERAIWYAGL